MTNQPANSYVDQYAPPTSSGKAPSVQMSHDSNPSVTVAQPKTESASQSLEDQNIFVLLGVANASAAEKEAFLDELQQVIWEDFLENDVDLLITADEKIELKKLMDGKDKNDLELQEQIVVYLEKLVPDLEEIMLEKALELKGDMVKERLAGMKEFFANKPEVVQELTQADTLLANDQWQDLAELLNKLSA